MGRRAFRRREKGAGH